MNTYAHQAELEARWSLLGTIPLAGVAEGAAWHRARIVATGEDVTLFVVRGAVALEAADTVRRAYLVEDPHLIPVREVVVFGDPRDGAEDAGDAEPTTVVEYPMPSAPPLAALLREGPLHPETARSIIGEAATGLEVARRRGLRHQFLDSNRVFVDTASGEVSVLGVGVEAVAHPDLDRSREVASFQDASALVSLLYRSVTGHSPRRGDDGRVPPPSQMSPQVPRDLDLLCDLVLNQADGEIPETTRALIAELEPWQSIPVTLSAYTGTAQAAQAAEDGPAPTESAAEPSAAPAGSAASAASAASVEGSGAGATAAVLGGATAVGAAGAAAGSAASGSDAPETAETPEAPEEVQAAEGGPSSASSAGAPAEEGDELEATQAMAPVGDGPAPSADASASPAPDAATGEATAQDAATAADAQDVPADATGSSETPAVASAATSSEARGLVDDLQLNEKRSSSAFPGQLDLERSASAGTEVASGGAAVGPDGAATGGDVQDEQSSAQGTAQPGGAAEPTAPMESTASMDAFPSRTPGNRWPLASGASAAQAPDAESSSADGTGSSDADDAPTQAMQRLDDAPAPATPAAAAAPAAASGADDDNTPADGLPVAGLAAGAAAAGGAAAVGAAARRDESAQSAADASEPPTVQAQPVEPAGAPDAASWSPAAEQPADGTTGVLHHGGATSPSPVPVAGRSESFAPTPPEEGGPIVVHGRDRSEATAPVRTAAGATSRSTLLREVVGVATDADDPETFAMGPAKPAERSRQSQWILLGAIILVIVALVIALTTITSGLRERVSNPLATESATQEPATSEPAEESPEPTEEPEPELPAAQLDNAEPFAEGGDVDHPEQADRLTDGDPGTFWSTQMYATPEYGGLKEGAGIRLHLQEHSTVTSVSVTTARNSGGTIELRTVGEGGVLEDVVATGEFAGDGELELTPEEPIETSEVVLWFPSLPQDSKESDRYRGRVAEIAVR